MSKNYNSSNDYLLSFFEKKKRKDDCFVIAEIGHNHKGSVKIAKNLFLSAKNCGASAVKLQKRSNKNLYTKNFFNSIYDNKNSYGKTYGEHREFLEFSESQYLELIEYSKEIGITFFATPFDSESVVFLEKLNFPAYKIASADLINTPLQTKIAETKKPIFLSTGGGSFEDIERAYKNITKINKNLIILHCTASYPALLKDMNLNVIPELVKRYSDMVIGLSDHENGIDAASIAYMLGARVFEKHFTLDRSWKGTDHPFSLEPQGLEKMIRNLKRIPLMLGSNNKKLLESEKKPLNKMYKSIVSANDLKKSHVLSYKDLAFKSPGGGLKPYQYNLLINKKIKKDLKKDDLITLDCLE
jgi:sialic acid synthase